MIIIVCGVSGCGKSTIGKRLAERLKLSFFDGDDFHPKANIEKMKSGRALGDDDRQPWLETLASRLPQWDAQGGAVLACSALKETYRVTLGSKFSGQINWVFLTGSEALLRERINARVGHFFDPVLLRSQLETLELPDYGQRIDIEPNPKAITNLIVDGLTKDDT